MGHAIVYCSNCSSQIRESDFEARRAFKVDDQVFCKTCCREVLGREPEAAPPTSSSTRMKAHATTSRIPVVHAPSPRESGSPIGWILAVVGIAIGGLLIALALSGGGERRPPTTASTPPPPPKEIPAPSAGPSPREIAAKEALGKAARFAAERPQELDAQRVHFAEAVARAEGTSLHEDARRELDRVDRRIRERDAAKPVAKPVQPPPPTPAPVEPKPTPPPTPPPTPAPPKEDPAKVARWAAAFAPATGRDHAASAAALEKLGDAAPDAQLLKSVAALHQEAVKALLRTPKGQKLALDVRDAEGRPRRVEGSFVSEAEGRLELRGELFSTEVELGEILPSSLLKSRGAGFDPAVGAVYCLLEGDQEGARRLLGDKAGAVAEPYWAYAGSLPADPARVLYQEAVGLAAAPATEADAIPKFQALLRDHAESPFVRRNKASVAARAQRCARDFLFVATELKAAGTFKSARTPKGGGCWTSEADLEAAKAPENFLELSYSAIPDATYRCWIYAGACCRETFEFWAQGTEMVKGKEREPAEPGSAVAAEIKPFLTLLKKTHSMHTGPKQPTYWEWIPIPLPKYAKAGPQRVRIMSNQKGFSVAYACVTSTRTGPPRELDMRELEKTRGVPTVAGPAPAPAAVIYAFALDGTDRRLVGELRDKALYGTNSYNSCLAGVEGNPVFTLPSGPAELRVTYFLKTATPLAARLRVTRGDLTIPYEVAVKPEAGRAVEVRIPLSDFKPANGNPGPALVTGDTIPIIYFYGQDLNCGLRIDALSVVELRPTVAAPAATPAAAVKPLFSDNFDAGATSFVEGEIADGGVRGKAYSIGPKGMSCWSGWNFPVKETTTIAFKFKPSDERTAIQILVWSEALRDNGRITVSQFKKDEWNEVKIKATDVRIGAAGDGRPVDLIANIKIFLLNTEAKALVDDFEIRP